MNAPFLTTLFTFALLFAVAHGREPPAPSPETQPSGDPPASAGADGESKTGEDSPSGDESGADENSESDPDFLERSNFVLSKIKENDRPVDPFGIPMDPTNPNETEALANQYEEEETPARNGSSLETALKSLSITGLYPNREILVLGARSFQTGDQFGLKLEELTIRLRFEGIKGKSVYFKDMDTQEVASIEFDPTPEEFEPVTAATKAPEREGIVPMSDLFIAND